MPPRDGLDFEVCGLVSGQEAIILSIDSEDDIVEVILVNKDDVISCVRRREEAESVSKPVPKRRLEDKELACSLSNFRPICSDIIKRRMIADFQKHGSLPTKFEPTLHQKKKISQMLKGGIALSPDTLYSSGIDQQFSWRGSLSGDDTDSDELSVRDTTTDSEDMMFPLDL